MEVRKSAIKQVNNEECTLAQAMARARADHSIYQKFFLTPIALSAGAEAARSSAKRAAPDSWGAGSSSRPVDGALQPTVTFNSSGNNGKGFAGKGRGRGQGKGKSMGRGQSKGKGGGNGGHAPAPPTSGAPAQNSGDRMLPPNWKKLLKNRTEDGREICFSYQTDKCKGSCGRVHICHFCGGRHPLSWHTRPGNTSGDAAGSRRRFR